MYQFVSSGTGRGGDEAIVDCDNWNMYSEQDRKALGSESIIYVGDDNDDLRDDEGWRAIVDCDNIDKQNRQKYNMSVHWNPVGSKNVLTGCTQIKTVDLV